MRRDQTFKSRFARLSGLVALAVITVPTASFGQNPASVVAPAVASAPAQTAKPVPAPATAPQATGTLVVVEETDLQKAYRELDQWLGRGSNGTGWRNYLKLDALANEIKSATPRREVLADTLSRLNSKAAGLEKKQFVRLQNALSVAATPNIKELPEMIRKLADQFHPISNEWFAYRRAKLEWAARQLDNYLATAPQRRGAWLKYLRFDEMKAEIAKGEKGNSEVLFDIAPLYKKGHVGLEKKQFTDMAAALSDYNDALYTRTNENAKKDHAARMNELAKLVDTYSTKPDDVDPISIGYLIGNTTAASQNPEVLQYVRNQFARPNLELYVHRQFITGSVDREIHETNPVEDNILGASVSGTATFNGRMVSTTLESPNKALIDLHMFGLIDSYTTAYKGPAVVDSHGTTNIDAHKLLMFDEDGLHENCAVVQANTCTEFLCIGSTKRFANKLITKMATKKAYENKAEAEEIAAEHAEERLAAKFNEQTGELVAKTNERLRTKFKDPLVRRGMYPQQVHVSTDANQIIVTALSADSYQLGAPDAPPKIESNSPMDVDANVHESMVNNVLAGFLAGRTIDRAEAEEMSKKASGKVADELKDENEKDWSITFDAERPIVVRFRNDTVKITIHGTEFTSDKTIYPAMDISATYKIVPGKPLGKMIRQGGVEIFPPGFQEGKDQLSTSQQSLRRILERRMVKTFKEEIDLKPIKMGDPSKKEVLLYVTQALSGSGWLQLGMQR
jgi:hypothetical protein